MPTERPSPFTIPEPTFKFAEGPPSEAPPLRSTTVGGLIHNLTVFANFYEQATTAIERAAPVMKPWHTGDRDVNADCYQREFRATVAIDRVRAYVFSQYGDELTLGTACRLLGDLIRVHKLPMTTAEQMLLENAMDLMAAGDKGHHSPIPPRYDELSQPTATGQSDEGVTPAAGGGVGQKKRGGRRGIPKAEADLLVRNYLLEHGPKNPTGITRDEIAAATGVSAGGVSKAPAWITYTEARDKHVKAPSRNISLTDDMLAVIPDEQAPPDELAGLIEEQQKEKARDESFPERRHGSS